MPLQKATDKLEKTGPVEQYLLHRPCFCALPCAEKSRRRKPSAPRGPLGATAAISTRFPRRGKGPVRPCALFFLQRAYCALLGQV